MSKAPQGKTQYLHEVDGVSTFKIPAVLLSLHTLDTKEEEKDSVIENRRA